MSASWNELASMTTQSGGVGRSAISESASPILDDDWS
jgi:hypothetical protein